MRKLFLHVGVHRTGTTSSQQIMALTFPQLLQRGYMYPYGSVRHDDKVRAVVQGWLSVADWAEDLDTRAGSHPHPVHSVILSDEDLSMVKDFSIFAPFADRFEVKIVAMMRRQDLWLESWYLQNVKWQWDPRLANLSFEEFLGRREEFHWIDYAARFAQYEALFGPGSVQPGVFERAAMPGGPTAALLRLMGIEDTDFIGPEVHSNPSLSPLMSEFVRHLPLTTVREPERRAFELAAHRADERLAKGPSRLLLTHDQRTEILARHAPGNAEVAARYFGRDQLFAEPVPEADAPLADRHLPEDPARLVGDFVAPFLLALARQFADGRAQMDAMQALLEDARQRLTQATQIRRQIERV